MTERKGNSTRQTKAGMLKAGGDAAAANERDDKPEGKSDETPKISKEKAEERTTERPAH